MTIESTPPSLASDGNFRLTFVPSGGNNLSAAILVGGTAVDLTYSLTPTGFDRKFTENVVDDPRLTMKQILHRPGMIDEGITVQYVYTDKSSTDKAYTALAGTNQKGGVAGFLTARYGVPDSTAWTAAQLADSISFVSGAAFPDAPVANGVFTITQVLYLTAPTVLSATIVT